MRLGGAVAGGNPDTLRQVLGEAREVVETRAIEEALVQSHLFVGFPGALEALAVWRDVSGVPPGDPFVDDPRTREERGEGVCRRVYGDRYDALRRNIAALHPDMDRWMVEEGYGKVLGRPGLELEARELCTVGTLAALVAPVQLYSHLRGALAVGVPESWVQEAVEAVEPLVAPEGRGAMWETWERVRARLPDERGSGTEPPETNSREEW